jgi:putative transposase
LDIRRNLINYKYEKKKHFYWTINSRSNNRYKSKLKLARKHEKIKNQRLDYLHNITTKIVKENQIIILEDLNVSGMMINHKLSKAIAELGLYEMRKQIEYKSKWYGREMVLVSRWYPSSKKCSCCGNIKYNLKLSDRIYKCDNCGLEIDRDVNASINIEYEGNRLYNENKIGQRLSEYTLVDLPIMDDKEFTPLKSKVRVKQEDETYIEINKFN